jgi:hypothetical protein
MSAIRNLKKERKILKLSKNSCQFATASAVVKMNMCGQAVFEAKAPEAMWTDVGLLLCVSSNVSENVR